MASRHIYRFAAMTTKSRFPACAIRVCSIYFQHAIETDPGYALAYVGLADSYMLLPDFGDARPREAVPKAKAAAAKAIEIDETLAEAHAPLGYISAVYDHDWAAAEREFKRAIEVNPGYATAHHWYALVLIVPGTG
jgi:tetratricopeptide (TPR) repeat protein